MPLGIAALLASLGSFGSALVEWITKRAALVLATVAAASGWLVVLLGVCQGCLPAASALAPPALSGVAQGVHLINGGALSAALVCVVTIRIAVTLYHYSRWVYSEANKA